MDLCRLTLALAVALPLAARAAESPAFDSAGFPAQEPLMRRGGERYSSPYQPQARQGLLLSVGLGGGSMYLSNLGQPRIGTADVDFRLGYGLSDRFQMFMDFNADEGSTYDGRSVGSWAWTMRGQTVLIGDRAGNGLNLNFGIGFGGLTYDAGYDRASGPTGLALAGGISYDARITPWCSFSPEFFYTWHQVPNGSPYADDVSSIYGLRLNLVWYLH